VNLPLIEYVGERVQFFFIFKWYTYKRKAVRVSIGRKPHASASSGKKLQAVGNSALY
jgi:hypothetical protein